MTDKTPGYQDQLIETLQRKIVVLEALEGELRANWVRLGQHIDSLAAERAQLQAELEQASGPL